MMTSASGFTRLYACLKSDLVPDDGRNLLSAHNTEFVGLGGESGDNSSQKRTFLFLERYRANIWRVRDRVDKEKFLIRVLACDSRNRIVQEKANPDCEIALLGRRRSSSARIETRPATR